MPQSKQYSPGIRYRLPELIEEEIEYLKREYGVEGISLLDEMGIPYSVSQSNSTFGSNRKN